MLAAKQKIFLNEIKNNKMADKPKKRVKVRVKEGEEVQTPEGYILNPQKSSKRKKVFDLLEGRRAKVKLGAGGQEPEIPAGYELSAERSTPGKSVYVKKSVTSSVQPSQSQFREPTEAEKKAMESGSYFGKNYAEYRDERPIESEQRSELVVKRKQPKTKDEGPIVTRQEKRAARQAERESSRVSRKFNVGCPIGRGRISRARY